MEKEQKKQKIIKSAKLRTEAILQDLGYTLNKENRILCPFHTDTTPSLTLDKKTNQLKCFSCEFYGDVFDLVMERQGFKYFNQALEYVLKLPSCVDLYHDYRKIKPEKTYQFKLFDMYLKSRYVKEEIKQKFVFEYRKKLWLRVLDGDGIERNRMFLTDKPNDKWRQTRSETKQKHGWQSKAILSSIPYNKVKNETDLFITEGFWDFSSLLLVKNQVLGLTSISNIDQTLLKKELGYFNNIKTVYFYAHPDVLESSKERLQTLETFFNDLNISFIVINKYGKDINDMLMSCKGNLNCFRTEIHSLIDKPVNYEDEIVIDEVTEALIKINTAKAGIIYQFLHFRYGKYYTVKQLAEVFNFKSYKKLQTILNDMIDERLIDVKKGQKRKNDFYLYGIPFQDCKLIPLENGEMLEKMNKINEQNEKNEDFESTRSGNFRNKNFEQNKPEKPEKIEPEKKEDFVTNEIANNKKELMQSTRSGYFAYSSPLKREFNFKELKYFYDRFVRGKLIDMEIDIDFYDIEFFEFYWNEEEELKEEREQEYLLEAPY